MTRIAIVGSREYPRLDAVRDFVQTLSLTVTVVTGGAPGVDQAAERAARGHGLKVRVYRPDWEKLGRAAGLVRNSTMVLESDEVVAFWDGMSRGTLDTIRKARTAAKPVRVFDRAGVLWTGKIEAL
jgi:hypothetical protein